MFHSTRVLLSGIVGLLDIAQESTDGPKAIEGCHKSASSASDVLIALAAKRH